MGTAESKLGEIGLKKTPPTMFLIDLVEDLCQQTFLSNYFNINFMPYFITYLIRYNASRRIGPIEKRGDFDIW